VNFGSTWGPPGVQLGSSWDAAGVQLGCSWGAAGLCLPCAWAPAWGRLWDSWAPPGRGLERSWGAPWGCRGPGIFLHFGVDQLQLVTASTAPGDERASLTSIPFSSAPFAQFPGPEHHNSGYTRRGGHVACSGARRSRADAALPHPVEARRAPRVPS